MHSIYLGIGAFTNAAGGSPPPSSEAVACSLTEFVLWLPAPLLSTLLRREPGRGLKGRESRGATFCWEAWCHSLQAAIPSSVPQRTKPCGPWGCRQGGGRTRIYPLGVILEATQQVSGRARMRAEPLLAARPLRDSELVSEARGLGKVSFVCLESSAFCFPI